MFTHLIYHKADSVYTQLEEGLRVFFSRLIARTFGSKTLTDPEIRGKERGKKRGERKREREKERKRERE